MSELQVAQPQPSPCPECGTKRLVAQGLNNIRLVPADVWYAGFTSKFTELWALVCTSCGHTTLVAKDPAKLQPTDH